MSTCLAAFIIGSISILFHPSWTTPIVIVIRGIASIFICYSIGKHFEKGNDMCNEPVNIQLAYFKTIFDTR